MKRFVPFVLLALTACGRDPQPPVPAGDPTPARTDAAQARYSSEYSAGGTLQLVDGHYHDNELAAAELDSLEARGDLNGDGRDELAVLLITSTGGSGVFRDLYVLQRDAAGQLSVSTPGFLGDRVEVHGLRVERGEVAVDLLVQGENDPLCCPTQPVTYRFRLAGNTLTEISGQQRLYMKQ